MHLLVDFRYREVGPAAAGVALRPARGCASGTCRPATTRRCSSASREIGVSTVGFEAAHLTVARHDWLARRARRRARLDVELRPTERVVEQLRVVKDAVEVGTLREGGAPARPRWPRRRFAAMRPGVTERARGGCARSGDAGGRVRASGLRHDCRVRAAMRRCRTTAPATGSWPPATSWCWTLAASWTDTAAT